LLIVMSVARARRPSNWSPESPAGAAAGRAPILIAGVDPGTAVAGVAIVEAIGADLRPILLDVVKSPWSRDRQERLYEIFRGLMAIFTQYRPHTVVVEGAYVGRNPRTALAIGEARAAAVLAAMHSGAKVVECAVARARRGVMAKGDADKVEVKRAIMRILNVKSSLWDTLPLDASDAAALAISHAWRI
jgi:crossover junction endodeoxyribonuclease RuvC